MTVCEDNKILFSIKAEAVSSEKFNFRDGALSLCVKSNVMKFCNAERSLSLQCHIITFPALCFKPNVSEHGTRFSLNLNSKIHITVVSARRSSFVVKLNMKKHGGYMRDVQIRKISGNFLNSKCLSFRL